MVKLIIKNNVNFNLLDNEMEYISDVLKNNSRINKLTVEFGQPDTNLFQAICNNKNLKSIEIRRNLKKNLLIFINNRL